MNSIAFLFSGQGSQYVGMGKEFYDEFPKCKRIYEMASDIMGFDVAKISFGGDADILSQTCYSQPLIYTHSIAAWTAVCEIVEKPAAVAGHSLGEYAALTCAGVFSIEQGMRAIKIRAQLLQEAAQNNPGAMYAVIGKDASEIEASCAGVAGYVVPVNYNSLSQTVIAGEVGAAKEAAVQLSTAGARVIQLAVNAAFHSKLMTDAALRLKEELRNFIVSDLKIPFYTNVYGTCLTEIEDLPEYLCQHSCSPVRFVEELQAMQNDGITTFIEIGPGKVLSGLVKKTLKGVQALNVENPTGFAKLKEIISA